MNRHVRNGPALASLAHHQEDVDFRKWLEAGGRERIDELARRFANEAKRHRPPQFLDLVTPAGTPYRLLKRSEERT